MEVQIDIRRRRTKDVLDIYGGYGDETCGVFDVSHSPTGAMLKVIASSGEGWDHISVSVRNRCPNWLEMQYVHRMFFKEDETAWEYHVRPADHINIMPNCLHLWRKHGFDMPMPPGEFV